MARVPLNELDGPVQSSDGAVVFMLARNRRFVETGGLYSLPAQWSRYANISLYPTV